MGMAASMGAILLTAGAKGKRFSPAPLARDDSSATGRNARSGVGHEIHQNLLIKERFEPNHCRTHRSAIGKVINGTDRDNYLSAQAAVEYGLIDKVLTSRSAL